MTGARSGSLFGPALPDGFRYQPDFMTADEERALLADIDAVQFASFEMRGVVARRRVAFFGGSYDAPAGHESPPMPSFLLPLRDRCAAFAGVASDALVMALINEYRPGAPIGWHRDAPQYGIVVGVSMLTGARMKLRRYLPPSQRSEPRRTTHEIHLEPRSAYLIAGEARQSYEHSIPPAESLRYSLTFRTLRDRAARSTSVP
jgi:alkylated DNA repair dioxygenase AlkB